MKRFEYGLWIALVLALVLVLAFSPGLIRFWPITGAEFLQLITPLLLVSLIIERTLEVFVTAWRGKESARLTAQAKRFVMKAAEGGTVRSPSQEELDLNKYKSDTQRIAFLVGLTLGIFASALGMRILELLVDPPVYNALPTVQRSLFGVFDVLLSGALLGGGSDGIHKLVSVFTDFLDKTREKIAAKP